MALRSTTAQKKPEATEPRFLAELKDKYIANIAHTFVFYGATYDYVWEYTGLTQYLSAYLTRQVAGSEVRRIVTYDRAMGIQFPLPSDREAFLKALGQDFDTSFGSALPKDPAGAFNLIGMALERENFVLIVNYAEAVFPAADMAALDPGDRTALVYLLSWAKDNPVIRKRGNMIFLITTALSQINSAITEPSSRIEAIGIPYPDASERRRFIDYAAKVASDKQKPIVYAPGFDVEQFERASSGLGNLHIDDILRRAQYARVPISQGLVRKRKEEIISQSFQNMLELIQPTAGFDMIGGYEYVKDFFRKSVIGPLKSGNLLRVPMGVLMTGPAGTGKTNFAEALAKETGYNCARFSPARTKSKWVGDSEANLEKIFWAIKSLTPIIVFIDEIDTAASRESGGDSNVSQNIMKRLLEVISDTRNRGKIIWVAATNKPENVDFALKRTGRFDKKIPILPPSSEEVPFVMEAIIRKHGITSSMTLADMTQVQFGWEQGSLVGSDLEAIILKAYELAEDEGAESLAVPHVEQAASLIRPSVQDIQAMVASALRECNDLSLIPEQWRNKNSASGVPVEEFASRNL